MANPSLSEIARRLIAIQEAPKSFMGYCKAVHPTFKFEYFQEKLIETLDALENQTLGKRQLLITMPPRHGKSTFASVDFPAYYMLRKPERKILAVSYGADLAKGFGRQVRDATLEPIIKQAFPNFHLSPTSAAVDDWMTTDGGKYYACGIGGGTTGKPANLLLIDDPIKNRSEAESPTARNKLWQFYNSSLNNRKEPEFDGTQHIEVLIQTRWHPDDLAGRIMETEDWAEGDWMHIDFPAISERPTQHIIPKDQLPIHDPRYVSSDILKIMPPEEQTVPVMEEQALWPSRFSLDYLKKIQRRDPREFAALYQQSPYIQGGNMVKTQWFNTYDKETKPDSFHSIIFAADTAFKTSSMSDFSVIMVLGLSHTGDIYVLDVKREKLDYPSLKRKFIMENAIWRGRGLRGIYIEDKASGQSILQDLRNEPGLSVIPYKFAGARDASDKVVRLNSVMPIIEGGRVFIPTEAEWLDAFLEEIQSFPNAKHDDQVDALAMGIDILSKMSVANTQSQSLNSLASQSLNSQLAPSLSSNFPSLNPNTNTQRDLDVRFPPHFSSFKQFGEL